MDTTALKTIRVLVREDAWPHVEEIYPEATDLSQALDDILLVEGTLQNAAAYLLEQVCTRSRRQAAEQAQGEVKKMKDASGEMEFFPSTSSAATDAETFCARAARLREGAVGQATSANPAPVLEPWEIT